MTTANAAATAGAPPAPLRRCRSHRSGTGGCAVWSGPPVTAAARHRSTVDGTGSSANSAISSCSVGGLIAIRSSHGSTVAARTPDAARFSG